MHIPVRVHFGGVPALHADLTAAAREDEARALGGDIDCPAARQAREGAALHQDEGQLVAFHHDVEHGATDAERAGRRLYLIAA
ncbi:MAG: hypothetical protein QOD40_422 [Alphaproteobacteria bacterium]|nr:hypothetical protein [Alphaproteobacteria bacterium]